MNRYEKIVSCKKTLPQKSYICYLEKVIKILLEYDEKLKKLDGLQ